MSTQFDVVVIGGGHNGLTAAALLAKRGRKTLLVERRDLLGGLAAGEEFHPEFRTAGVLHDTGSVRRSVVKALGLERHGLMFRSETPPILVPQQDGEGLLLWKEVERTVDELAQISPQDAERYRQYRHFLTRIRPVIRRLMDKPPPDIFDTGVKDLLSLGGSALALRGLGKNLMMEFLRVAPSCVSDFLDEWFESELLKAALAAPAIWATYTGPRSPGSTLNLLLADSTQESQVVGGPRALVAALENSAREQGVEIRMATAVEEVRIEAGRVAGVRLRGGEELSCRAVAASCDPKRLVFRHLSAAAISRRLGDDMGNLRARGTTAKINLALAAYPKFDSRPGLEAESLRIGESLEVLEKAFDAVKYRRFSTQPVLDVQVPTLETPGLAPEDQHVFSILVHFAPHDLDGGWHEEQNEKLYEAVMNVLSSYAPGINDLVLGREILSPADLEIRYGLTGGHVHHGEHAIDQLLVRPTPQCARYATPLEGLFLCGSGSHPGGGITCAPGAMGARALLNH
jgi:phytoene dehydrogenase-like protein